jgi:hypothetical protein
VHAYAQDSYQDVLHIRVGDSVACRNGNPANHHRGDGEGRTVNMYLLACGHPYGDVRELHAGATVDCSFCGVPVIIREMTAQPAAPGPADSDAPDRSYGCSWGCGNPYDYIIISVVDSTTELLCLVCMLKLMQDMIMAVLNPEDPAVKAAMADRAGIEQAPMNSGRVRKRGKNAPATVDDDDLIEAFDSRITPDELPEEMK